MTRLRDWRQRGNQIRRIKEILGPNWRNLFAPIDKKEQQTLAKQIVQQEFSKYYDGDYNKMMGPDTSQALTELRKFFGGGPLKGLEKNYEVSKADVPLIDEFIPQDQAAEGPIVNDG